MILPDDGMKSLLQTFYRRHLDLVDHLEISISQMTKDLFLFTIFFFPLTPTTTRYLSSLAIYIYMSNTVGVS